jgi:T4 RnlA family RNA ligase
MSIQYSEENKMLVVDYIRSNGIEALKEEFGIKVRLEGRLMVLNYCQIESPKTHPIVMECRGLILEQETLRVVSRSFDRFFNLGEALDTMPAIDWSKAEVFDKVDGSLIKIYNYNNRWEIATRGTAFADVPCGDWGITFRELVYNALGVENDGDFQSLMTRSLMMHHMTYIFELTSVENRVVKHYDGYKLHFLAARDNRTYEYHSELEREWLFGEVSGMKDRISNPKVYKFDTPEACQEASRSLKDLDEGYVVYQNGIPICKVKSPAYVAVHHIRGEGLNHKRSCELVLSGEVSEYLTYFPEDERILQPFLDAYVSLINDIVNVYNRIYRIEDQKSFAAEATKHHFSACLFKARAGKMDPLKAFDGQRLAYRLEQMENFL